MAASLVGSQLASTSCTLQRRRHRNLVARGVACWHLASLDAPTVAIVWAFAVARASHIHLECWIALLLASGTWTVYVFDRILDARRAIAAKTPALLRERHYIHWRYRHAFVPLAICTALAALAIIVKLMPRAAREHDSVLAAAALAYFSGVHFRARFPLWLRRLGSKEMLVGILFATGCAAPTLTRLRAVSAWPVLVALGFLAPLAWLNCEAISSWESHQSSVSVSALACRLALVSSLVALVIARSLPYTSVLLACVTVCAIGTAGLDRFRSQFTPVTVRALADLVLLVPVVLLLPGVFPG